MLSRHDSLDSPSTFGIWVRSRRSLDVERAARAEAARADGRCWSGSILTLPGTSTAAVYVSGIISCTGCLVPGTGYIQTDVLVIGSNEGRPHCSRQSTMHHGIRVRVLFRRSSEHHSRNDRSSSSTSWSHDVYVFFWYSYTLLF